MATIDTNMSLVMIDPNEPLELYDGIIIKGRLEWFLYALCCLDYGNLPTPLSRIEEWANALITNELPNMEPQSRAEEFFKAILTGDTSNLPTPQSRSEVLLDKLARGENDFTNVEKIQSRYEFLLAYLIKNGGGIGNIDYVLYKFQKENETLYNTIEKPFKSLELSGNTLVNCVLEDTKNDDYTSFDKDYSGTSFTINGTSEGAIKSAILSGQTLVNLFNVDESLSVEFSNNRWKYQNRVLNLIGGNKYYVYFFNKLNNLPLHIKPLNTAGEKGSFNVEANTGKVVTLDSTITNAFGYYYFKDGWTGEESKQDIIDNCKILFIEYQEGMENWDIPYFEGMQSVKLPVLTTTGKNLFDFEKTQSGYLGNKPHALYAPDHSNRTSDYIRVKPNTTYTYSFNGFTASQVGSEYWTGWYYYTSPTEVSKKNMNRQVSRGSADTFKTVTFTTPSDCYYVRIGSRGLALDGATVQLEEGSTATEYEPYKTNILSTPEDIELCGVGDIKDTLNCNTGEYIKRINSIILEENGKITLYSGQIGENTLAFRFPNLNINPKWVGTGTKPNLLCTTFPTTTYNESLASNFEDKEGICLDTSNGESTNAIVIRVLKSRLISEDVAGIRDFISKTKIDIVSEAESPVVKTVDLNVVDQNNTKIDKMHVFNEVTHVNASSDELTPTVNIGKSVSYPTIIKPNTKYTVDLKRNDKPLTVNLGGTEVTFASGETRKVITTPNTLTNDKLSYYGVGAKCNEIMLIEGEVERNIDYFTGMQSVVMQNQMPILCTNGKNLFNVDYYKNVDNIINTNAPYVRFRHGIQLEPNQQYILSYDDSEIPPYTWGVCNIRDSNYKLLHTLYNVNYWGNANPTNSIPSNRFIFNAPSDGMIYFTCYSKLKVESEPDVFNADGLFSRVLNNLQLEKGSTSTSYEPYKSSILSCNEDVILRGIGDVQDTLDCLTGEKVERVGGVVLDGSENWVKESTNNVSGDTDTTTCYYTSINDIKLQIHCAFACKELPYRKVTLYHKINDYEGISKCLSDKRIFIRINQSRLTEQNINGFKQWLSQNPITVQYELEAPTIKTVDLTITDQGGATIPKLKTFDKITHVNVSATDILPGVEMEVATTIGEDLSGTLYSTMEDIETKQEALKESNNAQTESVNSTMMAATEIYESLL